jgi:hypothetical protein
VKRREFITLLGGAAATTQHAASQRAILDQVCSKVLAPKNSPRCVQATISVLDLTLLTTNKMSGGQQLFGSNNLVIAGREQENRASYYRKINRASECCETPSCKLIIFVEPLNDLEIIGAGEIDGSRVPFAKERDQPQAARRSDIIRNLQQAVNCFGFERWMFPDLQQMRAADAPVPELYQLFEHRSRHAMGHPRQLGFACIDVDRCPCENESAYLAGIPRGIDKRHPAALTDPYQIGAAAELVHRNVEISKVAVN